MASAVVPPALEVAARFGATASQMINECRMSGCTLHAASCKLQVLTSRAANDAPNNNARRVTCNVSGGNCDTTMRLKLEATDCDFRVRRAQHTV